MGGDGQQAVEPAGGAAQVTGGWSAHAAAAPRLDVTGIIPDKITQAGVTQYSTVQYSVVQESAPAAAANSSGT